MEEEHGVVPGAVLGKLARGVGDLGPETAEALRGGYMHTGDAGYLDPAGNKVPETLYFGKGPALLFHAGKVERGVWTKKSRKNPVELSTASGGTMKVPAGHVWIELVPQVNGNVTFAK